MISRQSLTLMFFFITGMFLTACSSLSGAGGAVLFPTATSQTPPINPGQNILDMAFIESIEIWLLDSSPMQVNVNVKGSFPDDCTTLNEINQSRAEYSILISISTKRPVGVICTQQLHPFDINISLDISGLESGLYTIIVNGINETFTLVHDDASSAPLASLGGIVWHDLYAVGGGEGGAPLMPGPGCIPADNFYRANGIKEPGEPGLEGIRVSLGAGDCQENSTTATTTGPDGVFAFKDLQPGFYCVMIEPIDEQNAPLLIPGDWTYPAEAVGKEIASFPVMLFPGETKTDLSFGWDYQFLPVPPQVPTPVPTATPIPTPIPTPCNWIKFIADVTVPDYTPYSPGTVFTKTWRLQNIGTCSWTAGYDLVFVSGNAMTDKISHPLPAEVRPGEMVDLSVRLTAPLSTGNFKGSWMLRNRSGELFGLGPKSDESFWVLIKVIAPNAHYDYDFAANYCLAQWSSDAGKLGCPGKVVHSQGFVILLDNPNLENRTENEPALWLRPNHNTGGWVGGEYPPIIFQDGDHFKAWVGCLSESKGCQVTLKLSYRADGGGLKTLATWRETFDSEVTYVDVDLSFLARRSVVFTLSAEVNNKKFESANAFWFVPRIENHTNSGGSHGTEP